MFIFLKCSSNIVSYTIFAEIIFCIHHSAVICNLNFSGGITDLMVLNLLSIFKSVMESFLFKHKHDHTY